jgi:Cys-rich protein (TIGR01571 family)
MYRENPDICGTRLNFSNFQVGLTHHMSTNCFTHFLTGSLPHRWNESSSRMSRTKTIRVVAPATLEAGFTFDVLLRGVPYTVTVPPGGVDQGQEFDIPYNADENDESSSTQTRTLEGPSGSQDDADSKSDAIGAPMGRWRYSLLACCDVLTQATFWMSIFCMPVLMAQIITRLGLSWRGDHADSQQEASLSFNRIVLSFVGVLAVGQLFPLANIGVLLIYFIGLLLWLGRNLRRTVRQIYRIPSSRRRYCCDCLEDGICMGFCGCCSLIQMARQTHNDKEYPGLCCTTTGLELDAPAIPSTALVVSAKSK